MKHKILIASKLQNSIKEILQNNFGIIQVQSNQDINKLLKSNPEANYILINTQDLEAILNKKNLNPLTGLPGNIIINKTIKQSIKHPTAILYIDLDNFKAYNDKYAGPVENDDPLTDEEKKQLAEMEEAKP